MTRLARSRRRRGGFTLVELVLAVSVLAVFVILYAQVFSSTSQITRSAPQEDATAARVDMAINVLRRDVWHARRIDVIDPRTIVLHTTSDTVITWALSDDGRLSRTLVMPDSDMDPTRLDQWEAMDPIREFTASPAGITLTLHERWLNIDSQVAITSQLLAAGRATP